MNFVFFTKSRFSTSLVGPHVFVALKVVRTLMNSDQINVAEADPSKLYLVVLQQVVEGRPKVRRKALDVAVQIVEVLITTPS